MSKQSGDTQTLTQYLLGSLPAAEAERLDELSVTDDETAEVLSAVENDLIDAYVQGELDEATRAQFKTYYMASARRRERVAFAQAFRAQAEKSSATRATKARAEAPAEARTEAAAEVAPGRKGRGIFPAWRGFNLSRPAWAWGAAFAASALLIAVGWLAFDNARLRQRLAQTEARRDALGQQAAELQQELKNQRAAPAQVADERASAESESSAQEQTRRDQQPEAVQQRAAARKPSSSSGVAGGIASFILTPQMRGANQMRAISIPTNADRAFMSLRLEPNEFTAYRVTLLGEPGAQTLWRSNTLTARAAGDDKVLNFNLRARLLKPQTSYVLRVTNDAGEIVSDYPFRVVK